MFLSKPVLLKSVYASEMPGTNASSEHADSGSVVGFPKRQGIVLGGPHNKRPKILGSPVLGNYRMGLRDIMPQ